MRLVRGLLGVVLWLLASVVGLLGVVASVTLVLLPVGIPLVLLSRTMFAESVKLLLPRSVAHPVKESRRRSRKKADRALDAVQDTSGKTSKKARKARDAVPDVTAKATKRGRKAAGKAGDVVKDTSAKATRKARKATGRRRRLFG